MDTKRKNSKKRQAIYDALAATKEHPSAEMLYETLKPDVPDLSLGTVYRNLSVFVEDGDAVSVGNVDGQARYDICTVPHPHYVCRKCGRVMDIALDTDFTALYAKVAELTGAVPEYHALTFYGLCADCK